MPTAPLTSVLGFALTLAAAVQDPVAAQEPPAVVRPAHDLLRQNEDWSLLRDVDPSTTGDLWDRIKYVGLDGHGRSWLSFGGSAWFRSETWRGFNFERPPGQNYDDSFVLSRAAVHVDAHIDDSLRVFVEGRTVHSTDRDLPGGTRTMDADHLDLQQGFVDWTFAGAGASTTLRAGRQMFLLGNQRLVSPLPWGNALRSWEGLAAIHEVDDWTFTGMFTRFVPVDIQDFNEGDNGHLLYGLYGTHKDGTGGQDVYWLGVANQDATFNGTTGDEFRQTLGGRWWGPIGSRSSDLEVEGAGQFGQVGDEDVLTWMIASKFTTPLGGADSSLRARFGFDWASGDDGAGGDVGTFSPPYPLGHAYYGYIDHVGRQNAIDAWGGLEHSPSAPLRLTLDWHFFWLADDSDAFYNAGGGVVVPGGAATGTEVGNEIDLLLQWKIDRHATAILGYSHFFAGDVISQTGPDADIDFFYFGLEYFF
ncbi:MAG TPA: alginate export family protein [Planctomycetota bacterium]|nr:alginate export family protein [Planctomycetota bacterium]